MRPQILKQCKQKRKKKKWDSSMEAVWHFPAEAASATCSINLSVPGLDFVALLPHVQAAFASTEAEKFPWGILEC